MTTILRLPSVKARTGLSRSSIYAFVARGDFPAPVSLGARAVGWNSDAVETWIAGRIAQSRVANTSGAPDTESRPMTRFGGRGPRMGLGLNAARLQR
jgi:prophage regulatory protein